MCTITAHATASEILITMNRDEANMRGPEIPPRLHQTATGTNWLAPADSDKGGTWMGANEHGIVASLLNAYLPGETLQPDASGRFRSRGEIVPAFMAMSSLDDCLGWIQDGFDCSAYPSFSLFLFTPTGARCCTWHTQGELSVDEVDGEWYLETSSGWDTEEVRRWRATRFSEWREGGCETAGALPTFHVLQETGAEEKSPLMLRSWSRTRSITQVRVEFGGSVEMRYWGTPTPESKDEDSCMTLPFSMDASGG